MLRYVEQLGLVAPPRSPAGYRLYGPAELRRLRELRELLGTYDLELGDVGLALRLRREPALAGALERFLDAAPQVPEVTPVAAERAPADPDWLAFEQAKHQQLLEHA